MEMSRTQSGIIAAFGTGRSIVHLAINRVLLPRTSCQLSFACRSEGSILDSTWCSVFQLSYSNIKLRVATVL